VSVARLVGGHGCSQLAELFLPCCWQTNRFIVDPCAGILVMLIYPRITAMAASYSAFALVHYNVTAAHIPAMFISYCQHVCSLFQCLALIGFHYGVYSY